MKWERVTVDSVAKIVTKGTTPTSIGLDFVQQGIPFLRVNNIKDGKLQCDDILFIDQETDKALSRSRIQPQDVLLSIAGTIGRSAVVPADAPQMNCNQAVAIVRLSEKIDPHYFRYWLDTHDASKQITGSKVTATISNLSLGCIKELLVPLPPIAEQRRIAAILDRADAVRRKRQQAIALTEELLRSAFLEMFGDPVTNPKGWEVKPLGEIAQFVGGGTPSRKESKYFEGDICWATSKDMGVDVLFNTEEHITLEAIESSATKLVRAGCLLLVVKSKILMRRLPVARTVVPTCFSQDIKAVIPNQDWMVRYLHRHLRFGETVLLQQARGVNTEGLTLEHLRNYPVMLPLKIDIKRFADLDVAISNGIKTQESSAKASDNLFNSLLQRAFRGEL